MTSREKILSRVAANQPAIKEMPAIFSPSPNGPLPLADQFSAVLQGIGGLTIALNDLQEVQRYITEYFADRKRIISTIPELAGITESGWENLDPHDLETVDLAIIKAHFAVAENAALWVTETQMHQRVVPFICQQLAVVVSTKDILPYMHQAYDKIGNDDYGFGAFIAGPSKTADIEQSLVLGAHGPKSMIVFLLP
ncbi:LutC/YkgG family protein [Pedobacter sp. PWIIR3]